MSLIILIDDDELMRRALEQWLRAVGHDVRSASGGAAGLRLVDELAPDLVLTDLVIPDMDGFEIILELRRRHPGMPVVAMSGCARFNPGILVRMARQLGAADVLLKPFTAEALARVTASILNRSLVSTSAAAS